MSERMKFQVGDTVRVVGTGTVGRVANTWEGRHPGALHRLYTLDNGDPDRRNWPSYREEELELVAAAPTVSTFPTRQDVEAHAREERRQALTRARATAARGLADAAVMAAEAVRDNVLDVADRLDAAKLLVQLHTHASNELDIESAADALEGMARLRQRLDEVFRARQAHAEARESSADPVGDPTTGGAEKGAGPQEAGPG